MIELGAGGGPGLDGDSDLYERLAGWRDAVDSVVRLHTQQVHTVEAFDLVGAMTVQVAAGAAGVATAVALVDWCKPVMVMVCPPSDERPYFAIGLVGGEREVVLLCGKASEAEEASDEWTPPPSILDQYGLDDEEFADEMRRLLRNTMQEMAEDPEWHPSRNQLEDLMAVRERALPGGVEDSRFSATWAMLFHGLHQEVMQLRREQKERHRERLADEAEIIASKLMASEHAERLRRAPTQTEKSAVVFSILSTDDPCLTKGSCLPLVRAVGEHCDGI